MTIVLDEKLSAQVRSLAEAHGQDANGYIHTALARAVEWDASGASYDPDALSPEEIAQSRESIRRGMEAADADRAVPLKEWAAKLRHEFNLPSQLSDAELATGGK